MLVQDLRAPNSVQREREREEEVVASVVTAAYGEDSKLEVVASVLFYCTL